MSKPSDFFIGLLDFFAVLLPGIVLVCWGLLIVEIKIPEWAQTVAFLAAALILGNIAYGIGTALDEARRAWSLLRRGRLFNTARTSGQREQRVRDAQLAAEVLKEMGHPSWSGDPSKTYCALVVLAENERVAADVARLYALSRLFRSFSAVFLVILIAERWPSLSVFAKFFGWGAPWLVLLLLLVSFVAYLAYRRLHERRLYRAVVALLAPKIAARSSAKTALPPTKPLA